ncbi:unnamed protein product [Parascedosporium putredinis]|uniref:Uncharacterized protein n=1 Tax=Parascedosporium putredinis TaxID=1442378 RepID=A0A9P1MDK4_9PEZI|nr:unnamed protein product [Parascedosporium putredinis]CAI8003867.1 unnamed protein product [Parascedosporium putredinis]
MDENLTKYTKAMETELTPMPSSSDALDTYHHRHHELTTGSTLTCTRVSLKLYRTLKWRRRIKSERAALGPSSAGRAATDDVPALNLDSGARTALKKASQM